MSNAKSTQFVYPTSSLYSVILRNPDFVDVPDIVVAYTPLTSFKKNNVILIEGKKYKVQEVFHNTKTVVVDNA